MTARITALIVDDEPLARRFLCRLLQNDKEVEIVGECGNGTDAARMITQHAPDLVFLDVQMPEMDGFSVIEAVHLERLPEIIFTTAYEHYAIRAFELHAIDYLLKPFDQARFGEAMQHAKERLRLRANDDSRSQMAALLDDIKRKPAFLDRLIVKTNGRLAFVRAEDIVWIEADDKYVRLHSGRTARTVRQTLAALEAQLDPTKFLRIHRSSMVNIARIKELQPMFSGEHLVIMDDGTELKLSRNYKEKLFEMCGKPL